jgi:hypothetical protein
MFGQVAAVAALFGHNSHLLVPVQLHMKFVQPQVVEVAVVMCAVYIL